MASTIKKHHHTTAAATNQPKMYVYDLTGIRSRTPEYHPTSVATKKPASRGYIWGLKRSLKTPTKSKNNEADPISEHPKQVKESPVLETGRRSVYLVEDYTVKGEEPRRASLTTSFEEAKAGRLVEARKSVSHVDLNNVGRGRSSLAREAELLQVKVMVTDMPGFMQLHAFRCARSTLDSLEKFSSKHLAYNLKKEFDKVYGPAWHCIVGSSFGSFVTHSTGCFLYFSLEKLYIVVFRTKVQRASE